MSTETHKLAWNKLQGFLSCKFLIVETEVTFASHLATTLDSGAMPSQWVLTARLLQRSEWWEGDGVHRFYYTWTVLSHWDTDAFLFSTAHFPPYNLCVSRTETFRVPGCLKLLILKLFIIGHFSQGSAAKAFFQKGEISLAVTVGKLLVAELRQGWRKVKAVRVNPRWDASLHLHAVS